MTTAGEDPVVALLRRGHDLYAVGQAGPDAGAAVGSIRSAADRIMASAPPGTTIPAAVQRSWASADGLRWLADTDERVAALLRQAHASHRDAHTATRMVLDAAINDPAPAADTPFGRREQRQRMIARLRDQHRHISVSRNRSRAIAARLRRQAYRRAHGQGRVSAARVIPVDQVDYEARRFPAARARAYIDAALDRMGVHDPVSRRNWATGYVTLIQRESGGRPEEVAGVAAMAAGPMQPDGHRLGFARGIAQVLPATFATHHQPGTSTNIFDPVANICASMNWVMHRYGVAADGHNLVALVQQADAHRPPKGY